MTRYACFLRGINVGGRTVKMADLRSCLEAQGLEEVQTFLQSGNVVFGSSGKGPQLKQDIEQALTKTFGYPAKVQVFSLRQLQTIVDAYPFGTAGPQEHDYIIFMENRLERDLVREDFSPAKGEKVKAGKGVVYWRVNKGSTLKSDLAKWLTRAKYKAFNTNRNLKTLRKMLTASPGPKS